MLVVESIVYSFEIVKEKPAGKELVEAGQIVEQQVFMEIGEAFLHCFVESLRVGIHLRSAGISMIMQEMQAGKFFGKFFLELRTIISQYELHGIREDLNAKFEKLCRGQ